MICLGGHTITHGESKSSSHTTSLYKKISSAENFIIKARKISGIPTKADDALRCALKALRGK